MNESSVSWLGLSLPILVAIGVAVCCVLCCLVLLCVCIIRRSRDENEAVSVTTSPSPIVPAGSIRFHLNDFKFYLCISFTDIAADWADIETDYITDSVTSRGSIIKLNDSKKNNYFLFFLFSFF